MTLNLRVLVFFGLLTAGIICLVARSSIAEPFWSKATGKLDELLRCAGCSGFWLGLWIWIVARPIDGEVSCLPLSGVLGAALTPVVEDVLWGSAETAVAPATQTRRLPELFAAHDALDAIMDKLCDERPDLSADEIKRVGGTVKRALRIDA